MLLMINMTTKSVKLLSLLLGVCFVTAVIATIVLVIRQEHYPPYRKKTDWQRCRGASCKAPWATSKDFGSGDCHTSENFLGMDLDDGDGLYAPLKKKILHRKPDTDYERAKLRMSNRHGRYRRFIQDAPGSVMRAASNMAVANQLPVSDGQPDRPPDPPKAPDRPPEPPKAPPAKAPDRPPAKAPEKAPEKAPVVEKFPSSGRRYCYSTGSKVFAGYS